MTTCMRVFAVLLLLCGGSVPAGAQESSTPSRGPETAATQIEVFLSFSSELSARASVALDTLCDRRPDDVRVVFRHVVASDDAAGQLPHRAAVAAAQQGRFWELARLIFANQPRVTRDDLIAMASQLRLDVARFTVDLDAPATNSVFAEDQARAVVVGVTSAPSFIVNGKKVAGLRSARELESMLAPPTPTPQR